MIVPQLLDVEAMNLKCGMSGSKGFSRLGLLEEESVVIGILKASVNVEEACSWILAFVHNIGSC